MDLRKALGLESEEIEENVVNYELYLTNEDGTLKDLSIEQARGLQLQLLEHSLPFVDGYVWQRGHWDLHLGATYPPPWDKSCTSSSSSTHKKGRAASGARGGARGADPLPHLWSSVAFGDNVEDEWFIVWLLLELTKRFQVTARVWDNDGEFLLIEAAYSLPRWLKPEAATNRVWLHGGALHIVPLPSVEGDPLLPPRPTTLQALRLVRGEAVDTRAAPPIGAHIAQRLEGLPGKAPQLMHRVRVLVPAPLAHVLRREPQLIAPAVEAFHYRDHDDMRAAARMSCFPPQEFLPLHATFSQCLYAQLALQEFHPVRTYPMPLPSEPQFKAAEVGMKLAAGFEMLAASDPALRSCCAAAAAAYTEDEPPRKVQGEAAVLESAPGWASFRRAVLGSGTLHSSPEGEGVLPQQGHTHSTLEVDAVARRYERVQAYRRRAADLVAPRDCLLRLLQEPPFPAESYLPFEALPPDDSEAWLREGGAELEGELSRRQQEMEQGQGRKGGGSSAPRGDEDFDPEALASQLRRFMDMTAGLEGAEVPAGPESSGMRGTPLGATFDEGKFAAELERVLGLDPGAFGAVRGGDDDEEEEGDVMSESSEEGSSFYTDGGSSSSGEEEEGREGGDGLGGERRGGAGRGQQASSSSQRFPGGQRHPHTEQGVRHPHTEQGVRHPHTEQGVRHPHTEQGVRHPHTEQGVRHPHTEQGVRHPHTEQGVRHPHTEQGVRHPHTEQGVRHPHTEQGVRHAGAVDEAGVRLARAALQERWEVGTATDSDDDDSAGEQAQHARGEEQTPGQRQRQGDARGGGRVDDESESEEDLCDFMDAYSRAMQAELAPTTLGRSFLRAEEHAQQQQQQQKGGHPGEGAGTVKVEVPEGVSSPGGCTEGGSEGPRGSGRVQGEEGDGGSEMQPLDMDLNVVEGLLASFHQQQGLPGPASNLAGLLGIHLPPPRPSKPE